MIQKMLKIGKVFCELVLVVFFVSGCIGCFVYVGCMAVSRTHEWWTHRHEPSYVVWRVYDSWERTMPSELRADMICASPARCEPSGKPNWQYFMVVKKYELVRLGLNPEHEMPYEYATN